MNTVGTPKLLLIHVPRAPPPPSRPIYLGVPVELWYNNLSLTKKKKPKDAYSSALPHIQVNDEKLENFS